MKNEEITQGPLFAVQDSVGAWCVTVGNSRYDQQVAYIGTDNRHIETGSAKGNAQLFAAAPDLLEAMKDTLATLVALSAKHKDGMDNLVGTTLYNSRAAIAKAEGRA